MIEVTDSAAAKLSDYLTFRNIESPIRIATMNGCGGPSLGLALDEQRENDLSHRKESLTVLIDQDLSQNLGKVTIDYKEAGSDSGCGCGGGGGFSVTAANPLPNTGGGCGGSCSSGCSC